MKIGESKIRCPKCEWEPSIEDLWQSICGYEWNTFTTYGKCPSCSKVYLDTQCLACEEWSPHADWYVDLLNIEIQIEETEKVSVKHTR